MKKACIALLLVSLHAEASLLPNQSDYYYRLGGASDLFIPPVSHDQIIIIGGNVNMGMGLNCSLYNPVVSIANSFNDMKEFISGVPHSVVDNLKAAAIGYPLYKLQQSMPALYNILENTAFRAQNEFTLRVQDCQNAKRMYEQGNSPLSGILSVSDSQGWIDAAKRVQQGEKVDITKTAKDIAQKGEDYGLPWVHRAEGNSGGKSQKPIKVINDVVIAGYNLMLSPQRSLDSLAAADRDAADKSHFVRYWPSPEKAANWAVMVLGDIQVTHKKEAQEGKAGVGLSTLLQSCPRLASSNTCVANISDYLWKLIDGKVQKTEENLRKISAANLLITEDILTAIQRMPREQQLLTVSKLAEEIAIQNLLDEAMMLKRLLQAGFQIQEVQNLKPVQEMVLYALKKLDNDIHSLAFENEVRKKMMTETLQLIMGLRNQDLRQNMPNDEHEQALVKNGAVYRKESQ